MRLRAGCPPAVPRGFSLIELLIVVTIIAVMAAVSVPAIARYLRNYQIRGAAQQVAGGLQQARLRAISKNVNLGVLFAVVGPDRYRIVIEDDQRPLSNPAPVPSPWRRISEEKWDEVLSIPAQAGPEQRLPAGIQFDNPARCPRPPGGSVAGTATDWGIRFGRLGAACGLSTTNCGGLPRNPPVVTNYVNATPSLATVCLSQPTTGLFRWVNVTTGGRVRSMQ